MPTPALPYSFRCQDLFRKHKCRRDPIRAGFIVNDDHWNDRYSLPVKVVSDKSVVDGLQISSKPKQTYICGIDRKRVIIRSTDISEP
jgi:hypothetical protein